MWLNLLWVGLSSLGCVSVHGQTQLGKIKTEVSSPGEQLPEANPHTHSCIREGISVVILMPAQLTVAGAEQFFVPGLGVHVQVLHVELDLLLDFVSVGRQG